MLLLAQPQQQSLTLKGLKIHTPALLKDPLAQGSHPVALIIFMKTHMEKQNPLVLLIS